jgi:hypothetical protein
VVIELKWERTPREVVAQVLEYGFWVERLSYEEVADLYARHHDGDDFDSAFSSRFESESPETVNTEHKLFVLASGNRLEYRADCRVPARLPRPGQRPSLHLPK